MWHMFELQDAGYDWKGDARNIGHHGGCSSRKVLAGIVTPENEACKVSCRGKVAPRVLPGARRHNKRLASARTVLLQQSVTNLSL
jgi:hypothetical protein